ncbi:unnamed protein product, partial [Microthlaspi erraticum]
NMKLLFPEELIDENLEGFKERVTRTLKLFPKAVVPRDIHGEIVYPAVNHPPDTHCKEKRLGGSRMPLDRRRKRCENTIRAKTLAADAQKVILAEQFSFWPTVTVEPGRNSRARPDISTCATENVRAHARTGKETIASAEFVSERTDRAGRSGKHSLGRILSAKTNLADQIARPRQNPSAIGPKLF